MNRKTSYFIAILLFISILNLCSKKNSTEPEIIPLDGRGGGIIAYCYQPITSDNTKKEIHAINADGSGNIKIIDTDLSLNHHDWSPDAQKFAAVGYFSESTWSIYVFNADGTNLTRLTTTADVWDNDPSWSPDGSQIAFTRIYPTQNREEIWIMNADGSDQHWIDVEGGSAKWSPGGKRLIYHSLQDGNYDIYTCNTDGTDEKQLTSTPSGELTPVWSPDGTQIALTVVGDDLRHDIYVMKFDGTNLRRLTNNDYGGGAPKWSPDGSLITFHSGPSEEWEVFVINSDGTNLRQVTNSPNGITAINPVWQPSGNNDFIDEEIDFPVQPTVLVQGKFSRCEGIAFNGEGNLYVAGDKALWRVDTLGQVTKIVDAYSNLGLAPIDSSDILFADFGPRNAFDHGYNRDGIVWRVTPDGTKTTAASGMGDPNFVLVLQEGSFLVSDDATDEIFIVKNDGSVSIFTQQVDHPNGMAISKDGTRLYIAQMFKRINPYITDGRVWMLRLNNSVIQGEPEVIADFGDAAANDGLTMDVLGRIYVACWGMGQIWRFNPHTGDRTLIAENLSGVASMTFGQGEFDHQTIYATSTLRGVVWKVPVGVEGMPLHR